VSAVFNGHSATWCDLPLLGLRKFNDEAEQHLITAALRVRLDGGFSFIAVRLSLFRRSPPAICGQRPK